MPIFKPGLNVLRRNTGVGGFVTGGGGGISLARNVLQQFEDSRQSANQANESRFQEIKSGFSARRQRALDLLKQSTGQRAADIRQTFAGRQSQSASDLVSRGLSGTTIKPTIAAGIAREEQGALNQLRDQEIQRQIGVDAGLEGDRLAFLERRTDTGPDTSTLLDLARRFGAGFGGGGGGGSRRRKIKGPTVGFSIGGGGGDDPRIRTPRLNNPIAPAGTRAKKRAGRTS